MVCIHCGGKTQVVNSRAQKRSNQVWRRRRCLACQIIFTSEETVQHAGVWRVKSDSGSLQPFGRDKLFLSLYKSCQHRQNALEDAGALTGTIVSRLATFANDTGVIESKIIVQTVLLALNRFDKAASTHYKAFHTTQ